MDRTIVLHQHHGLGALAGLWTKESVKLLEIGDEVAGSLGRAGVFGRLADAGRDRASPISRLSWPVGGALV
jgi:hypothetical protein